MGIFTCCFSSPTTDTPELDQTDHPSKSTSSKSLNPFKRFTGNHGAHTVTNNPKTQALAEEYVHQKETMSASINQGAPLKNALSANYYESNGTVVSSSVIYSEFPAS